MHKKKNFREVAAGVLIPSVLLPSCTPSNLFFDTDVVTINRLSDINAIAVPVNLVSKSRDALILNFMGRIAADIVENPVIAKQFAENPQAIAEIYGVADLQLDFDDELWKLIQSLGDNDIHEAILRNDINQFLSLCKKKELISAVQKSELTRQYQLLVTPYAQQEEEPTLRVGLVAGPVAAVVGGVVGGVVAGVGAVAAVWAAVYYTTAFWSASQVDVMANRDPLMLQVWMLKNGNDQAGTYVMLSAYQEQLVNDIIEALKNNFPDQIENIDENELRTLISINIL